MSGNIKLEIVYYAAESDPALEFGMRGNFSVRVLSSHVATPTELIAALKKASVRNEFIVVVGGFENSAVVGLIARSIGRELVLASQHSDTQPGEQLLIPADAIPLVADNDEVCGAVIESGYQSIILLSGQKERRDRVIKPLLLPYLNERYMEIHASQFAAQKPEQPEQATETAAQTDEAENPDNDTEPQEKPDDDTDPKPAEDDQPEPEQVQPDEPDEWQNLLIEALPDEHPKKKKHRVWLVLLIVFLSFAVVCGSAFSYLFYFVPWQHDRKAERFATVHERDSAFTELRGLNSRITGWIDMQAADIEAPVVYTSKDKPNYDRYHLLDGTLNPLGTPFVKQKIEDFDGLHIVRMDGYYDKLCQYLDADFTKENRRIQYDSTTHKARWRVFSAFTFGKKPAFDYLNDSFSDPADYARQLYILKNASEIGEDVTVEDSDIVAVFTANRFDKTIVVAALLIDQTENIIGDIDENNPNGSEPSNPFLEDDNSSDSSSGQGTTSSGPVIDFTPDNSNLVLDDKVEEDTNLPPLTNAEINDNLNIPPAPPVSSAPSSSSTVTSATSSATSSQAAGQVVTITGAAVNVREGAGTENKSLGRVVSGQTFPYLGTSKDKEGVNWYKIQYTTKQVAYVSSQFAKLGNADVSSTATSSQKPPSSAVTSFSDNDMVITVLSNQVNVRAGAGINYKSLGVVNLGQYFKFISEKTVDEFVWYNFQYTKDTVGWIRSDFAKKSNKKDAPTLDNIAAGTVTLTVKNGGNVLRGSALDIVASVIEAEMSSSYPLEALKAQAVATYSFLLVRGAAKGTPVVVPMKTAGARCRQAAKEVLGQCAYYNGQIAQTYYFAISAGYTANCQDVWTATLPYLKAVESKPDSSEKGFATQVKLTSAEIKEKFNAKYPDRLNFDSLPKDKWFACTYDENNAYCKSILIANILTLKGDNLCTILGLRSGAFTIKYDEKTDTFTFNVRGYGHGVGMSQVGAKGYANQGWTYKQILQHYYTGVEIR